MLWGLRVEVNSFCVRCEYRLKCLVEPTRKCFARCYDCIWLHSMSPTVHPGIGKCNKTGNVVNNYHEVDLKCFEPYTGTIEKVNNDGRTGFDPGRRDEA